MIAKNIMIAIAGAEGEQREWEVQVFPGVPTRHIIEMLGLSEMTLMRPDGGEFGFNQEIYPVVNDGQMLICASIRTLAGG